MIRSMSYLLMALMVIGFLSADYLLFTSSTLLHSFVSKEIRENFGDNLQYERLRLRLGSILEIDRPQVKTAPDGRVVFRARRAEVTLTDRRAEEITLYQPELILSQDVLDSLDEVSWTDLIGIGGSGDSLPKVTLVRGSVRADTPAGTKILEIREGEFVPSQGAYWIRCRLTDEDGGEWMLTGSASGSTGYRLALARAEQDLEGLKTLLGDVVDTLQSDLEAEAKVTIVAEFEGDAYSRRSRLVARMRDARFTVAIAQDAGRKLRFEGMTGEMVVSEGIQVVLRSPRGRLATQVGGEAVISYTADDWGERDNWEFHVEFKGFPLSQLGDFLPSDVTALWREFAPDGTADFSASIGPEGPRVRCQVRAMSFRVSDDLRVEGLEGVADYDGVDDDDGRSVQIWRLANAPLAGDIPMEITGRVTGLPAKPVTDVTVTARDLDFPRLRRVAGSRYNMEDLARFDNGAVRVDVEWRLHQEDGSRHEGVGLALRGLTLDIAPDLVKDFPRNVWDELDPQGDLTLYVERDASNGASPLETFRGQISNASFHYRDLLMDGLAGEVAVEGERIHLRAERPDNSFHLRFDKQGHNGDGAWEVRFDANSFPVADLVRLLPEDVREEWSKYSPSGSVDLSGTCRRDGGWFVQGRVRDGTFRIPDVMELDRLEGMAEFDGHNVRIWRMTGGRRREGDPGFEITGSLSLAEAKPVLEATVRCEDFAFARFLEIAQSRVDLGKYLRPVDSNVFDESAGKLDMEWTIRREGDATRDAMRLKLKGVRLTCSFFPIPLEDMVGDIQVRGSRIEFTHVEAVPRGMAPSEGTAPRVVVEGFVDPEARGLTSEFKIDAQDLELGDGIEEQLPEELRPLVRFFHLRGRGQVRVDVATRGREDPTISFVTQLRLNEASMNPGVEVANIVGSIYVGGVRTRSNTRLTGHLDFTRAVIAGHRAGRVYTSFTLGESMLILNTIRASLYGGEVTGSVNIALSDRRFNAAFRGRQISLEEYSASQRRYNDRGLSGRLSFDLQEFQGTIGEKPTYTGHGRVQVRDGVLWGIPVFLRLVDLDFTQLGRAEPEDLGGEMTFEIARERVEIPKLMLSDGSMTIVGRGYIRFDGQLYMALKTKPDYGIDIPLLNLVRDLFNELKGEVYAWEATGSFEDPRLSWKMFPSLFPGGAGEAEPPEGEAPDEEVPPEPPPPQGDPPR